MSDIRPWSEEGASEEELALLARARAERPDPSARLRTLQALGIGGGPPAPPSGTGAGGSGGGTASAGTGTGTGAGAALPFVKIAAAILLVGGAIAGVSLMRRPGAPVATLPAPASAPAAAPSATPAEPPPPATIAPPAADVSPPPPPAAPAPAAPDAPPAAPARRHRRASPPPPDVPARAPAPTLAAEVQALEQAQRALAARDPAAALRALDRYDAEFPAGKLAAEGVVLRVRALLQQGQRAQATALARAFAAKHPDGAYARQLDALIRGAGETPATPEKK